MQRFETKKLRRGGAVMLSLALVASTLCQGVTPTVSEAAAKPALSAKKGTFLTGEAKTVKIKNVTKKNVKKLVVSSTKKAVAAVKKSGKTAIAITSKKAGKATMPLEIGLWSSGAPESGGTALVNASCEGWCGNPSLTCINLWRNIWKDKSTSAAAKSVLAGWEGVYTLSAEDGGYLSLTVGKTGDVKVSGKLGDGKAISSTVPLMYQPCYDFFAFVCVSPSAYKGGFVCLPVGFDALM